MEGPKPLLNEFAIQHRLKSCVCLYPIYLQAIVDHEGQGKIPKPKKVVGLMSAFDSDGSVERTIQDLTNQAAREIERYAHSDTFPLSKLFNLVF